MSRPEKMAAYWMDGYEPLVLVRGTTDPSTAARFILEHGYSDIPWMEDDVAFIHRDAEPGHFVEDAKSNIAEWVEKTRSPERVGYFRFNVQPPGGEYAWMLDYVDGPGRGNFQGVLFNA